MSERARSMFLEAKKDWSESASQARAEKDKAREQYNEATEMGLTQDSFEDWISAYSAPAFTSALNTFRQAASRYQWLYTEYDVLRGEGYVRKLRDEHNELYYNSPEDSEDYHSAYLIITPDE